MAKLALAIIVKDEIQKVKDILNKYSKYFDEVSIAVDYLYDEFNDLKRKYNNLQVHKYTWINDFSHKRNWLAERIESEYYLRIDTDDDIVNPDKIRDVFEKMVSSEVVDIVYCRYLYSHDIDGNVDAEHWRETIIKKRPDIYWKKEIHENIFIEDQNKFRGVKDTSIAIFHNIDKEHALKSMARNWEYLKAEYARDGINTDPRTIAYIGRMLIGIKKFKEAISFLELLINKSNWDDDKYFAYVHMSQCHQNIGNMASAIACCNEALNINTKFPDAYIRLGELYICKEQYDKAIDWLEIGVKKEKPDTLFVLDPSIYTYRVYIDLSIAYFGKGDFEKAILNFNKAKEISPNNDFIKNNTKLFNDAVENDKYFKYIAWIVAYTQENDPDKLNSLVKSIPKQMLRDERIVALRNKYIESYKWPKGSVVIYCGAAWEDWAAPSVLSGIGGSEEAVIYLSKELNKLGKKVTVYCSCGDLKGVYDNVIYKEYFEFNPKDSFDILIAWRNNIFTNPINANKKLIWLHDVPDPNGFPEESLSNIDKIIVLSKYHKSLLPEYISDEKIFVSSNGINTSDFYNDFIDRNPKRLIYTSSYDRGLQHLLEMWGDIRKSVPNAELHIFYGWNTYDSMVEKGVRKIDFKLKMQEMMNQEGVFDHGRVGHKQLSRELFKSGIYAYTSHFEEISCISAMKAQASGCIPVVTDYAALSETVKYGIKIPGKAGEFPTNENYKTELINLLLDEDKQNRMRSDMLDNRTQWGWDKVAEKWVNQLFV